MKKDLSLLALSCVLSVVLATPVLAAPPKPLGKFGYWSAYQMVEGNAPVCYMSITAKPPAKVGNKKAKRGEVVLMITHRPSENALDVVSYAAGAKFKSSSDVTLKIGSKSFNLFTQGDTAWSRDQATDRAVVEALRGSGAVTISGSLLSGVTLADTVNLKGFNEAYVAIGKACGQTVAPLKTDKPKAVKATPAKPQPAQKKR